MAVRDAMSITHRQWTCGNRVRNSHRCQWTRAVTRADYCSGTWEGSCISGYSLIFHVCDDDVLRVWYTVSCCLSRRTDWVVGASAAVRGCSGRCVVDDETAAAQECFEQVRVEVGGSAAVRGCAAGACEQVPHHESHHVSRVVVAAERGSLDRTTGKDIQTRLGR